MTRLTRGRRAARLTALATGLLLPVVVAAPAFARDDGEVPGKSLGSALTVLIYVVIPVGAFLVISMFAALPSLLRRPRYRPGRPWSFAPMWFTGPDDPNQALVGARAGATARGGASAEW